jgi:AmmeMemoRadiSam system protein A
MPPSPCVELDAAGQSRLLEIARESIEQGLTLDSVPRIDLEALDASLRAAAATFVTLTQSGALRGCIGSLQALDPLAQAVANAAFNAAFRDRRFQPLAASEVDFTQIEISVLSAAESLSVASREDLLERLRPGIDGLIIEDRGRRATFLPKVWEKIPSAEEFLQQLFQKAGLAADHWSSHISVKRYSTYTFAEN